MWMQGSTYSQPRRQEEVEWLALRSTVFTPGTHLQEAEWTPGPVWTQGSEKSAPLRHPGSNIGRPARSQASCRLSYLAHTFNTFVTGRHCLSLCFK